MFIIIWPFKNNGSNKYTKKSFTFLKEKDLLGDPEQGGLVRYWKASRRDETASKKSNRKTVGRKKTCTTFCSLTHVKWKP
jgi:hypothetical protein